MKTSSEPATLEFLLSKSSGCNLQAKVVQSDDCVRIYSLWRLQPKQRLIVTRMRSWHRTLLEISRALGSYRLIIQRFADLDGILYSSLTREDFSDSNVDLFLHDIYYYYYYYY